MKRKRFHFRLIFGLLLLSCHHTGSTSKAASDERGLANQSGHASLKAPAPGFTYDLANPARVWKLPADLVEVSGNAWVDANHLLLIDDLHPVLYLIKLDGKKASLEKKIPFAATDKEKLDIEDVAYVDNTVYALWSHGILFKISNWQNAPQVEQLNCGLKKENNTEGVCYDPVRKQLLIACKDDAGVEGEKKSARAVYQFDITKKKLITPPLMLIQKKDFEGITGDKISFNPSAIAVHPITHDLYILTTRDNKGMAIFSHEGVLKQYQQIQKDLMAQPEGICFSPGGELFISSEGKHGEPGSLFSFEGQSKK